MSTLNTTKNLSLKRVLAAGSLLAAAALTTGCASMGDFGLPGGGEAINKKFFATDKDMMDRLSTITAAVKNKQVLSMPDVLAKLDRERLELNTMNRTAIRGALEGTGTSPVPLMNSTLTEEKLSCKEGLSFTFSDTNSKYAFNNPIKWQQATKGFSYNVEMIFNGCNGAEPTLETVIIDGGPIDTVRKKTVFDLFSTDKLLSPRIGG